MCVEYENFDIIEVAKKCGIHFHCNQRNHVEFKALCPFCNDTKYHLGLNRKKGMFHCFKCGESGNSVSLYAKIFGVDNRKAYEFLKQNSNILNVRETYIQSSEKTAIKALEERHNVYYDFLKSLKLQNCHRQNLLNRGLDFRHIHQFMYRSIPLDPVFRREVIEDLTSKHELLGIPGFYRDEHNQWQMYFNRAGGMLIPVCNSDGYIQGLQIRLDVEENSSDKKFRWFSSKHFKDGTGAAPWIHVVGDTNEAEACLTEGPMKADITSVLSGGKLFLALPGVNSIGMLPETLANMHITKVYEALDMDKRSKPEVRNALITLKNVLRKNNVECVSCSWDPRYKGIDDYCYAKQMQIAA